MLLMYFSYRLKTHVSSARGVIWIPRGMIWHPYHIPLYHDHTLCDTSWLTLSVFTYMQIHIITKYTCKIISFIFAEKNLIENGYRWIKVGKQGVGVREDWKWIPQYGMINKVTDKNHCCEKCDGKWLWKVENWLSINKKYRSRVSENEFHNMAWSYKSLQRNLTVL